MPIPHLVIVTDTLAITEPGTPVGTAAEDRLSAVELFAIAFVDAGSAAVPFCAVLVARGIFGFDVNEGEARTIEDGVGAFHDDGITIVPDQSC